MKKIYKDRLIKLADFLSSVVKPKRFDLTSITDLKNWDIDVELDIELKKLLSEKPCEATACAIGYLPYCFPRSFKYRDGNVELLNQYELDFGAAQSFFGINQKQSEILFDPIYYPPTKRGAKSVAERIRKFVREDGNIGVFSKHYIVEQNWDDEEDITGKYCTS